MLLITMHEWFGPGNKMSTADALQTESETRHRGFLTSMPLGRALNAINTYQNAYNDKYRLSINFELLTVSKVPTLTSHEIKVSGAVLVEDLPMVVEEF